MFHLEPLRCLPNPTYGSEVTGRRNHRRKKKKVIRDGEEKNIKTPQFSWDFTAFDWGYILPKLVVLGERLWFLLLVLSWLFQGQHLRSLALKAELHRPLQMIKAWEPELYPKSFYSSLSQIFVPGKQNWRRFKSPGSQMLRWMWQKYGLTGIKRDSPGSLRSTIHFSFVLNMTKSIVAEGCSSLGSYLLI